MWRTDSLEKTLMLGKIEGRKRREWQDEMVGWHHWLNGHEFEQALGVGDGQQSLSMGLQRVVHDWATELNWTEPTPLSRASPQPLGFSAQSTLSWWSSRDFLSSLSPPSDYPFFLETSNWAALLLIPGLCLSWTFILHWVLYWVTIVLPWFF